MDHSTSEHHPQYFGKQFEVCYLTTEQTLLDYRHMEISHLIYDRRKHVVVLEALRGICLKLGREFWKVIA